MKHWLSITTAVTAKTFTSHLVFTSCGFGAGEKNSTKLQLFLSRSTRILVSGGRFSRGFKPSRPRILFLSQPSSLKNIYLNTLNKNTYIYVI